jgi:hypothetical protein
MADIVERTVDADVGDLWVSVLGTDDPYPFLRELFGKLYRPGSGAAAVVEGPWMHLTDNRGGLMFSALVHKEEGKVEVRAMYPYTESGYLWPVQVKVAERSSRGTCTVLGGAYGVVVGIFDTMAFRRSYKADEPEIFQVSAIALRLTPEELPEGFAPDFCMSGPARRQSTDTSVPGDVLEVHSVVEAVEPAEFWGTPLTRYLLTLARPGEHALTLDVYANDARIGRRFAVGDRVAGFLWVFGFRPDYVAAGPPRQPTRSGSD